MKPFIKVECAKASSNVLDVRVVGSETAVLIACTPEGEVSMQLTGGGTLFIEEVARIGRPMQDTLLQVLEGTRFDEDVRGACNRRLHVIAATSMELQTEVAEGRFREDLYYSLRVAPIYLPPLRERKREIRPLVEHFAAKFSAEMGRSQPPRISREALEALVEHPWPGNVEELQDVIRQALVAGRGLRIEAKRVRRLLRTSQWVRPQVPGEPLRQTLERTEIEAILRAVEQARGDQKKAATTLGIHRTTLYKKIKRYDLMEEIR